MAVVGVGHWKIDRDAEGHKIGASRINPVSCRQWCSRDGSFVHERRMRRRCTRRDFVGRWTEPEEPKERAIAAMWWHAAPSDDGNLRPPEPKGDGCPAGWALCTFAESVSRYLPIGDHANPRLSEADDLVIDAVRYYTEIHASAIQAQREAIDGR